MPDPDYFAALAARREGCARLWELRFRKLFADAIVTLPARPAAEAALHLHAFPFAADPQRSAGFIDEHLQTARDARQSISLDVSNVAPADMDDWLDVLDGCLAVARPCSDNLLISIAADHPAALRLLRLRARERRYRPRVAFRLTAALPRGLRLWDELVAASHTDPGVEMVPAGQRQLSALHSRERDRCVLPQGLFQAQADTAWLVLEVNAVKLGNAMQTRRRIGEVLRFADNLIEETVWPRPALALDALLNRRVAIHVQGLGELMQHRALVPDHPGGFVRLKRWLKFVRSCLLHESAVLARQRGPFPGCGATQLIAELTPRYGEQAARRLMRHRFLRHRHLLALSPFALFPPQALQESDMRWLDLIPALACADVLTMRGSAKRRYFSAAKWEQLLHMTHMLDAMRGVITHKRLR